MIDMIADRAQIKELLQITNTTYDAVITELIPIVQKQVIDYCNSRFWQNRVRYTASTFSFTARSGGSMAYISDSDSGFTDSDVHFYSGMDIYVDGSYNNDGHYQVDTVAAGTLTLSQYDNLVAEDTGEGVTIYKVDFPAGLALPFAQMINYNLQKSISTGVKSERIGEYSVTYADAGGTMYPANIVNQLKPYRRLKWQ